MRAWISERPEGDWLCSICQEHVVHIEGDQVRCNPDLHADYYRGLREARALAASVAVPVERLR